MRSHPSGGGEEGAPRARCSAQIRGIGSHPSRGEEAPRAGWGARIRGMGSHPSRGEEAPRAGWGARIRGVGSHPSRGEEAPRARRGAWIRGMGSHPSRGEEAPRARRGAWIRGVGWQPCRPASTWPIDAETPAPSVAIARRSRTRCRRRRRCVPGPPSPGDLVLLPACPSPSRILRSFPRSSRSTPCASTRRIRAISLFSSLASRSRITSARPYASERSSSSPGGTARARRSASSRRTTPRARSVRARVGSRCGPRGSSARSPTRADTPRSRSRARGTRAGSGSTPSTGWRRTPPRSSSIRSPRSRRWTPLARGTGFSFLARPHARLLGERVGLQVACFPRCSATRFLPGRRHRLRRPRRAPSPRLAAPRHAHPVARRRGALPRSCRFEHDAELVRT